MLGPVPCHRRRIAVPADAVTPRDVNAWLEDAVADARRRGLPELEPLLTGLAQATAQLRAADWNDDAGDETSGK